MRDRALLHICRRVCRGYGFTEWKIHIREIIFHFCSHITLQVAGYALAGAMNYPAASYGVSKTARNDASFGEYDPERFKSGIY
jgi:hypothetical protein